MSSSTVFVTGASGYIGGRLVPRLLEAGYNVRCLSRNIRKLRSRPWFDDPRVELIQGEVSLDPSIIDAMSGCKSAYYLVHSMMAVGPDYAEVDRQLATDFSTAAEKAGVERIVYLGGLGETGKDLSEHLTSRREVEKALASSSVPVTTLRAAMIIGSGSASFETLRYLVERLPVMVTPKWVTTQCQPVAVKDVLHALVAILEIPETIGETYDIGGPDVKSYDEIMQTMAQAMGLRRRWIIPVPVLTPRLSSLWIHLVTPISHRIARPLAEGLRNRVVCRDNRIEPLTRGNFLSIKESIERAVQSLRDRRVETAWSDAGVMPGDPDWAGGAVFTDRRSVRVNATTEQTFRSFSQIGGSHGYWSADWLWAARGALDRLFGGPGLRRGRRDPVLLEYGDAVDFWRVTDIKPDRYLELTAEMRLPGIATLAFEVDDSDAELDGVRLTQTARFKPRGLLGLVYWYAVMPLHFFVFQAMLRGIRGNAEARLPKPPRPEAIDQPI